MKLYQFLFKNLKKTKGLFILFMISFVIVSVLNEAIPFVLSRLVACFKVENKQEAFNYAINVLYVFVGVTFSLAISRYFTFYLKERFVNVFQSYVLIDVFTSAHAQSTKYFDDKMSGVVSSAVVGFSQNIMNLYRQILFDFLRPLISFIFSLSLIATFSPMLAISLILLIIPIFIAFKSIHKKTETFSKGLSHLSNKLNGVLVDSIANHRLVKYCGNFFSERLYFYKCIKNWGKEYIKYTRLRMQFRVYSNFCGAALSLSGFVLILYFAKRDNIAIENIVYAFVNMNTLNRVIGQLNNLAQNFFENYGSLKANFETIYNPIDVKDKEDASTLIIKNGDIEFKNVNFSYIENKPIFSNLSFKIDAKQKFGIVGHSGAGKSTLVNLLLRSYDINSGDILIDNQKITDVTQNSLHKNIALVSQDTALFNRSILENLKIVNPKASLKEVQKAAKQAQIHDTIIAMENGYDSVVGERGLILSGGERQRISIARAILQNAPILILDEATSALDTDAEIKIEKAINELIKNKTVIAVAHRLSTLKNMDRIVVFDNGEILEDNTWENLLNKTNGKFLEFYNLQFDSYKDNMEDK